MSNLCEAFSKRPSEGLTAQYYKHLGKVEEENFVKLVLYIQANLPKFPAISDMLSIARNLSLMPKNAVRGFDAFCGLCKNEGLISVKPFRWRDEERKTYEVLNACPQCDLGAEKRDLYNLPDFHPQDLIRLPSGDWIEFDKRSDAGIEEGEPVEVNLAQAARELAGRFDIGEI